MTVGLAKTTNAEGQAMAKVTITIEDTEPGKVKLRVAFSPAINPLSRHDTTPALDLAFALLNRAKRTQNSTRD